MFSALDPVFLCEQHLATFFPLFTAIYLCVGQVPVTSLVGCRDVTHFPLNACSCCWLAEALFVSFSSFEIASTKKINFSDMFYNSFSISEAIFQSMKLPTKCFWYTSAFPICKTLRCLYACTCNSYVRTERFSDYGTVCTGFSCKFLAVDRCAIKAWLRMFPRISTTYKNLKKMTEQ